MSGVINLPKSAGPLPNMRDIMTSPSADLKWLDSQNQLSSVFLSLGGGKGSAVYGVMAEKSQSEACPERESRQRRCASGHAAWR